MPSPHSQAGPPNIFISYRRSESSAHAGRLHDQLSRHFGPQVVFIDRKNIEAGRDFVEAVEAAVGSCAILLAVIGPQWLTSADAHGRRRLDDPEDFVRLEIAAALKRNIRVIPVLIQGAAMPDKKSLPRAIAKLARRQSRELSENRWNEDVRELIKEIEGDIGRPKRGLPVAYWAGLIMLVLLALGALSYALFKSPPGESVPPEPTPAATSSPTPVATPADTPAPTPGGGATPQSNVGLTPTPTPTRTPRANSNKRKPGGNCNQKDILLGLC